MKPTLKMAQEKISMSLPLCLTLLTHRLPIRKLRVVFALMLYAFALRMLFVVW